MSDEFTPAEQAAIAVDGMRRLWLEIARLSLGEADPPEHVERFHEWLHGLPFAATPPVELGATAALGEPRTRWMATGAPASMISATNGHLRSHGAAGPDLDLVAALGPAVDPLTLGSWIQFRGGTMSAGWSMDGGLDPVAASAVLDDDEQRAVLLTAVEGRAATVLRAIGRSVDVDPVSHLLIEVGPASDDDAMSALIGLAADLHAPAIGDEILGVVLHEAGDRPLALSVWTLGDGLARVGVVVEEPPTSLLVHLAMAGDWGEGAARAAALLGSAGVETASRLEWFIDAGGPNLEVTVRLPHALPLRA